MYYSQIQKLSSKFMDSIKYTYIDILLLLLLLLLLLIIIIIIIITAEEACLLRLKATQTTLGSTEQKLLENKHRNKISYMVILSNK